MNLRAVNTLQRKASNTMSNRVTIRRLRAVLRAAGQVLNEKPVVRTEAR